MTDKQSSHIRLAETPQGTGTGTGPLVRPGIALRNFRAERGLTLAAVSERSGLPISTLSKIENDKMDLTIDKLLRISLALDVNVADIFGTSVEEASLSAGSKRRSITRGGEGHKLESPWGVYRYQAFDILNKNLTPALIEVKCRDIAEFGNLHRHRGEEFIYVVSGELALYTDTYTPAYLSAGDTAYFDSDMAHGYVSVGEEDCRILSVFSTPTSEILDSIEKI